MDSKSSQLDHAFNIPRAVKQTYGMSQSQRLSKALAQLMRNMLRRRLDSSGCLALDLDDIVAVRNLAICQCISMAGGKSLSSFAGYAVLERRQRQIVSMECDKSDYLSDASGDLQPSSPSLLLIPRNFAPSLQINLLVSADRDTRWARLDIFENCHFVNVAKAVDISYRILRLLVTKPCRHLYSTSFQVYGSWFLDNNGKHVKMCPMFTSVPLEIGINNVNVLRIVY